MESTDSGLASVASILIHVLFALLAAGCNANGRVVSTANDASPAIIDGQTMVGTSSPTDSSLSSRPTHRLVIVTTRFGFTDRAFRLGFPGDESSTEVQERDLTAPTVQWSRILLPLQALKSEMLLVSGLALLTSYGGWPEAPQGALTGQVADGRFSVGPSLDWLVAQLHRPREGVSLVVAGTEIMSFDDTRRPIIPVLEPADILHALFPSDSEPCRAPTPAPYRDLAFSARRHAAWMDSMIPLIVDAFRCDRTRVFAMHGPDPSPRELGSAAGNLDQDINDQVSASPEAAEAMIRYGEIAAGKVAELASALKSVRTEAGTLLDETIVLWVPGWGAPGQLASPYHAVLLGGKRLGIKAGRELRIPQTTTFQPWMNPSERMTTGFPHNRLLRSVAKVFGVERIGEDSMFLRNGQTLNLAGEIPLF